jgi:AhpD family alkylhydroperoxidase
MRLAAIENPPNLFLKIAYWFSRRQFGKVLSLLKIIYARKPQLLRFAMKIDRFEKKQTSLPEGLRLFIKFAAAAQNGCAFCTDIALAQAVRGKIGTERFLAIANGDAERRNSLTEKERAVFAFVKQYAAEKKVSDATFAALRKHFDETEIVEIVALNAFEQFYNALTIPLEIESDELCDSVAKRA